MEKLVFSSPGVYASLLHTSRYVVVRPVGTADNSPAVYCWVTWAKQGPVSPVGTTESRIVQSSLWDSVAVIMMPRLPSSKLLGYYQMPLRGRNTPAGRDLCVTARRLRLGKVTRQRSVPAPLGATAAEAEAPKGANTENDFLPRLPGVNAWARETYRTNDIKLSAIGSSEACPAAAQRSMILVGLASLGPPHILWLTAKCRNPLLHPNLRAKWKTASNPVNMGGELLLERHIKPCRARTTRRGGTYETANNGGVFILFDVARRGCVEEQSVQVVREVAGQRGGLYVANRAPWWRLD